MIISKVCKDTGKKYKVYSEEGYLFSLYFNELKKYGIDEGKDVPDVIIEDLMYNVVFKRGKERALYLLERKPYTVYSMKRKLVSAGYPETVTEKIICFLIDYNYLNDNDYVSMYVNCYNRNKSRRQMEIALISKGIDRQLISDYFERNEHSDQECFVQQYNKYVKGKDISDPVIRNKVFRHFYSKGFSTEMINNTMRKNA